MFLRVEYSKGENNMGRNHKRVTLETLKKASELNLQVSFNNYNEHDGFIKPYMTTVTVNGKTINGLQNWDNGKFEMFMALMTEYAHGEITLDRLMNMASEKRIDAVIKRADGSEVKEYAKDSYRWSQVDLIDKWHTFAEMNFDYNDLKLFMVEVFKKTNTLNPKANGWNAGRMEEFYLTHKILPKFIREQLQVMVSNDELIKLANEHTKDLFQFADSLHRLAGDVKVKDDLYFQMGLLGE